MENENMSIDVDEFVDSGIEEAGDKLEKLDEQDGVRPAEEEEVTTSAETKSEGESGTKEEPAEKETEAAKDDTETETSQQADSTIAALIKNTQQTKETEEQTTDDRVPLEVHTKLRKRAQTAEARVKELEAQQTTHTEGEDSGELFTDKEEDDLVRVGEVRKVVGKVAEQAVQKAVGQVNQTLEQRTAQEQLKQAATKAVQSEAQVKKDTPDYNKVTAAANKLGLLTEADRQAILQDAVPAKKYYELAKKRLTDIQTTLGINPSTTTSKDTTTKEETGEETEEEMSDDEVFNAVYGGEE